MNTRLDNLQPFFEPRGVAVIGASAQPGKGGHIIVQNLLRCGFRGPIYPVNPRGVKILDLPSYPTIAECPDPLDLAVLIVPREAVPASLEQAARRGVQYAIIASGGFTDAGDALGLELDAQVRRIAAEYGIRYMGPNSIGTIDAGSGFITSITANDPLPPGNVSILGQTGLLASGLTRMIADRQPFGVRRIACLGNKNDLNEIDFLRSFADDDKTGAVGCYLEGVKDGRDFLAAAQATAQKKPLIVLKGGVSESGSVAAASHTGSLAGSAAVFHGALRQVGAIEADSLEDLFDLLSGFGNLPLPKGPGLGLVSITGAGCVLGADYAERYGLQLPKLQPATVERIGRVCPDWSSIRNPVDMWPAIERNGVAEAYRLIGLAMASDPGIDLLILTTTLFDGSFFDITPVIAAIREIAPEKPVATVLIGGGAEENRAWTANARRAGAATFADLSRAIRVLGTMAKMEHPPVASN